VRTLEINGLARAQTANPRSWVNLADRAAYALAKTMNAPLLFKGNDFAQTDLRSYL
jgi:uncharacterized protein with PIN domain